MKLFDRILRRRRRDTKVCIVCGSPDAPWVWIYAEDDTEVRLCSWDSAIHSADSRGRPVRQEED